MFSMASTNLFTYYASLTTSWMMLRSVANEIIPEPYRTSIFTFFENLLKQIFGRFMPGNKPSTHMTILIHEQSGITRNEIFEAAQVYLRTKINPNTERLIANKTSKKKSISLSMEKTQEIFDRFKIFEVKWQFVSIKEEKREEETYYEVTFEKLHKDTVVNEYLPFVLEKAKEIKDGERAVKLYTQDCSNYDDDSYGGNYGGSGWGCITLDHPVTFDKLAMDPSLKKSIMDDLDRFLRRKDYYKKVGKAWKRGYLLYGPPGTGKSSLIAAMANYLRFDVYDLELSSIYDNSSLRRMLLGINNRSIIIIEDIDCNSQTHDREDEGYEVSEDDNTKLTLSGLLNFIDGLWSTCGDERIIIFTTNHKDKLDPALLRPGRMDMHIYMGYCTVEGFDVLAYNYLGINDHPKLFPEIKELIKEVEITPAELAEHLMRDDDVDLALKGVIGLLKQKKDQQTVMQPEQTVEQPEEVEKTTDAESEVTDDMKKDGKKSKKHKKRSKGKNKKNH